MKGVFAAFALVLVQSVLAENAAIESLRLRSTPRWQRITVASGCQAFSYSANEPTGFSVRWEGPCLDGLAHGDGIQRISALGEPVSAARGRYEEGQWVHLDEGYALRLGSVIAQLPALPDGLRRERVISVSEVPSWAMDIAAAQPAAAAAWEQDVARRMAEMGNPRPASADDTQAVTTDSQDSDRELLFVGEDDSTAPPVVAPMAAPEAPSHMMYVRPWRATPAP